MIHSNDFKVFGSYSIECERCDWFQEVEVSPWKRGSLAPKLSALISSAEEHWGLEHASTEVDVP